MAAGRGSAGEGEQAPPRAVAVADQELVRQLAQLGDADAVELLVEDFWASPQTVRLLDGNGRVPWAVQALREVDAPSARQIVALAEALPNLLSDDLAVHAQALAELVPLGPLAVRALAEPLRAYAAEQQLGAGEDMDWNEIREDAARLTAIIRTITVALEAIGGPEAVRALAEHRSQPSV